MSYEFNERRPILEENYFELPRGIFTPLYPSCRAGSNKAQVLIRAFTNHHKISDACQVDLLKLLEIIMPNPNLLPSAFKSLQSIKLNLKDLTAKLIPAAESQTVELLQFAEQLDEFCIDLILSTDGVTFVSSSVNHQMYPVWLSVAQLPPILRMSKKNIALAALFVGNGKPNWEEIVKQLTRELQRKVAVRMPNGRLFCLKFHIVLIVADLIEKPNLLNMYQQNGYYGCQYCTHPGVTYGSTHPYYPLNIRVNDEVYRVKRQIREPTFHENLVEKAEKFPQQGNQKVNMVGVKGRSAFSCVVPGLPLSAPVDYMHCVLLGVYASLLARHMKLPNKKERVEIDDIMYHVAVSVELSQHGRQPRVLSEVSQFKANEYFNYLFFLAPVVFRDFL